MRAALLVSILFCCAAARAADDPASGKYHLDRAEALAREGKAYDAAREAQQAYWLDPSLKAQADALLAKVHGGKAVDPEFGARPEDSPKRRVLIALAALAIAWFLSRFVRLSRHDSSGPSN